MLSDPPEYNIEAPTLRGPEHPLWEREVEMERGMLRDGADRVRDRVIRATERKQMTRLAPVRGLMQDWLPEVAAHLRSWIRDTAKSRGPKSISLEKLRDADPWVMSLIAVRTILDSITTERTAITGLAMEIGRNCEHEQQIRAWEQQDPELFYGVQAHLDRTDATSNHRKRVNINRFNHLEPPRVSRRLQLLRGWSHDEANPTVFS